MSDRNAVEKLKKLVPSGHYQFEGDKCIGVHLVDPNYLYFGLARHLSASDKKEVLRLISQLDHLRYLDLRKNKFGPIELSGELRQLEYVDLASNYMGEIPEWLKGLPLKYLNLGVNVIEAEAPDWFAGFDQLRVLKVHKNKIRSVDSIANCRNLNFLNLYFNWMRRIPNFVWDLEELQFFSWGVSGITSISEEIARLQKLQWLSMVANRIQSLPEGFCELKSLRGVRLHKNRLETLPENIGNLSNLEQLTLYKNRLTSLPESFGRLRLRKLNLGRNEFEEQPQVTAEWNCYETRDYFWHE